MKYIVIAFVHIFSTLCINGLFAQETRNLDDFQSVYVLGNIDMELIKSSTNKLVLSEVSTGTVSSEVKKGVLHVSYNMVGEDAKVVAKLYYKDLIGITAKTAVTLTSTKKLLFDSVSIRLSKGAKGNLKIEAKKFNIVVLQGSRIDIQGAGEEGVIYCNAGGACHAKDFKIKNADVRSVTGGEANVYVYGDLVASTHTGGRIFYFVEPKKINAKSVTGGVIRFEK